MAAHIDLHQVPFGNAQIQGGSVQCQHGPDECKGNKYECCAIQLYPNASQWFPFNVCMENAGDNMLNEVQHCATKAGLDYQKIESCYSGEAGVQCIKNAAAKTNALNPPHRYTPWVTVNGEHLAGVQHLLSVVCSKIEGDKPAACSSATDDDDHMYNDDQQGTPLLRGVSE